LALFYIKLPQIKKKKKKKKRCLEVLGAKPSRLGWFASLASCRAKSHEILVRTILSRIGGKQQKQ